MKCDNTKPCPCPNKECENNGKCCQCLKKHVGLGGVSFCVFPKKGDKSLELFYQHLKERFEK